MMKILTEKMLYNLFDEYLDDINGMIIMGESEYFPSIILKKEDPVGYRDSYLNWLDSMMIKGEFVKEKNGNVCGIE